MRKLEATDLNGKTIKNVNADSTNYLRLTFDDDTELDIWCECAISTSAGDIWGFFIDKA